MFEPGDIEQLRKAREELEAEEKEREAREDSYRNGLYANRHDSMENNSSSLLEVNKRHSSGGSAKIRKLFKREEPDPYAATHDRGDSAKDEAVAAIALLAPNISAKVPKVLKKIPKALRK